MGFVGYFGILGMKLALSLLAAWLVALALARPPFFFFSLSSRVV